MYISTYSKEIFLYFLKKTKQTISIRWKFKEKSQKLALIKQTQPWSVVDFNLLYRALAVRKREKPLHILVFLTVLAVQGHIGEILSEKFRFKIKRKLKDSKRV